MPKGVYQRTEEGRINLSKSHLGKKRKPFSEETKRKMGKAQSTRIHKPLTEEHKNNIAKGNLGKACPQRSHKGWNKDKTGVYDLKTRKAMGAGNIGRPNVYKGKSFPLSHKLKLRDAAIKRICRNDKTRFSNTVPEKLVKTELELRGVKYIHQYHVIEAHCAVDFFLPEFNVIIECDGNYWHNLPGKQERDRIRTEAMTKAGYIVYRFWERELKMNVAHCIDKIIQIL